MSVIDSELHKLLAGWAADCAAHVLAVFEKDNPEDERPRKAIEAVRAWVQDNATISEVRKLAFDAHAAARDATQPEAVHAARAAGHAAATAHVFSHASYAALYAVKAAANAEAEQKWQQEILPDHLQVLLDFSIRKTTGE